MAIAKLDARPWYREPWPWIIIAGPASAVVAGVALLWFAIDSNDGLVVDDYYKEGLAINQVIRRDQAAYDLRYRAQAVLSDDGSRVRVFVTSASGAPLPDALRLRVAHPTRAGKDQTKLLAPQSGGWYEAALLPPEVGRWLVTIEDPAKTWRLSGNWQLPDQRAVVLAPPRERAQGAR
jgi:hypothetical protein